MSESNEKSGDGEIVRTAEPMGESAKPASELAQASGGLAQAVGELAEPKKLALELLMWGKTVSETARQAGVSRITIHRWLKNDPVFRAAYNEWHEEMRESSRSRLETMAEKAMNAVENALHAGDARMGLQLLKGLGLLKERKPGPTDAAEVKKKEEIAKEKKRMELYWKEVELGMG